MKFRLQNELLVIWLLSLALVLVAAFTEMRILRVVLGIPFVFIFPGYTLLAALFPGGDGPGALERLMLSVGLSVVILIVGGLFLNNGFRGIDEVAVFAYLFVFVTAMSILASYRRWRAAAR